MKVRVRCKTPDEPAAVFIMWGRKGQISVCAKCWEKIADKDWECGNEPIPTLESLFSDEAKGLIGAVLTEYVPKGSKKGDVEEETKDEDEEFY
jgi:hypothetical protein